MDYRLSEPNLRRLQVGSKLLGISQTELLELLIERCLGKVLEQIAGERADAARQAVIELRRRMDDFEKGA